MGVAPVGVFPPVLSVLLEREGGGREKGETVPLLTPPHGPRRLFIFVVAVEYKGAGLCSLG